MTEYEAFFLRVQTFRRRLLRFLEKKMHSSMHGRLCPEDILSELTVKCPRNVGELLSWPQARFCGWLKRVAERKLCSAYREHLGACCRSVHRETSLDAVLASSNPNKRPASRSEDPAAAILRAELVEQLRASIERLPQRDRQVLVLRFLQELSPKEVARQLGVSAETYRKREYRARLQLEQLLLHYVCM